MTQAHIQEVFATIACAIGELVGIYVIVKRMEKRLIKRIDTRLVHR